MCLENRLTAMSRGFESHTLRHILKKAFDFAGSYSKSNAFFFGVGKDSLLPVLPFIYSNLNKEIVYDYPEGKPISRLF